MLYRGTTPSIVLHINNTGFNLSEITVCHVIVCNDSGRNKKIFTDCVIDDQAKTVTVNLTHDDTIQFEKGYLLVQMRAKVGDVEMASPIMRTQIGDTLEDAEL